MTWLVRESSLLGRALAAHEEVGAVFPEHGVQLERVARWGDAGKHFDRLAKKVAPAMPDEFASRLLSTVVSAALDAAMVASRKGTPTILKRRAAVEARYAKLLSAIDTLDRIFGVPQVHIVPTSTGETYEETSIAMPAGFPSDDRYLRLTVEAWRVALGHADPTSNDAGPLRTVLYQTREAPAALRLMRAFLLSRKSAELGALDMGTLGRKTDGAAQVRTFVILLDRRMREGAGFRDVPFVTTMANALFVEDGVEVFDEGVRKILERAARRQANAEDAGP